MKMKFPYSRRLLWPSFIASLVMSFVILGLIVLLGVIALWSLLAFLVLVLAVVLLLGSPLASAHLLTPDTLYLRYGLVFRSEIPMDQIASVRPAEERPISTGVYFSPAGRTIYITTEPRNLVAIMLKERRRFPCALGKSADRIVISVTEPERLVATLMQMRGSLPPV